MLTHATNKHLVLVGGGHSHAIALKLWRQHPLPHVRLTLISDAVDTPYSGMLPGHVAGFYSREACFINLRSLANQAGADFIVDQAIGLNLETQQVLCAHHAPVAFDLLSLDIGSTPTLPPEAQLPTNEVYHIPAKPIRQFLQRWQQLLDRLTQDLQEGRSAMLPLRLGIVGGGVGGVELTLAVQRHLREILQQFGHSSQQLEIHLLHRGESLMPERAAWVGQRLTQILSDRGIHLHLQAAVETVQAQRLICTSGFTLDCDYVFWVTQASAAPWLQQAGLSVDSQGFVQVNESLQSLSHPQVFAAGDIATLVQYPRPKAGVFAVRQGTPLFHNWQRALQSKPLQPYCPQGQFLTLIGTSDKSAIANRGEWGWESPLMWWYKDWLDRRFMAQFSR